ncbi:MAG TPA: glycerol-3-phosphate dehydrogenase/oxidase [Longimicrobiales bacterium]|nr:glycerol-3-phosphate dehydrogenase/oxidase [Longimicrobiales bacterium]
MNRSEMLAALESTREPWDVIVVGGGATGLGVAVDAAVRGYRTLLLEQDDFAKGTSSRSTKLVHGGVRYLQQGNVALVLEALRERGLLIRNAPHLVRNLGFVVPHYDWWEGPFYGIGLKVYDVLAGKLGLGPSRHLSREETLERLPTIEPEGLRGGVIYYDGQFDDARLAISLARTAARGGATLLNYARVSGLLKNGHGLVAGVRVEELEGGRELEVRARVVVNATGVFTDALLRMDSPDARAIIEPSQGIHIVLDPSFHPGESAIMVPHTDDGRVLFAVPWHGRVIVGTTDTAVEHAELEPRALDEEVDFLLSHAARYLAHDPTRADVLSVFAGLRPLVKPADSRETASIARDHTLLTSASGLVTITGGKWTTYRKMAQDTVDQAIVVGGLEPRACETDTLALHGYIGEAPSSRHPRSMYGSDEAALDSLEHERPELAAPLHEKLPYRLSEVVWAVRHEMARTLEDVLSRRTRSLLLDARAAAQAAPAVVALMATELGRDEAWQRAQLAAFERLAAAYRLEWRQTPRS